MIGVSEKPFSFDSFSTHVYKKSIGTVRKHNDQTIKVYVYDSWMCNSKPDEDDVTEDLNLHRLIRETSHTRVEPHP